MVTVVWVVTSITRQQHTSVSGGQLGVLRLLYPQKLIGVYWKGLSVSPSVYPSVRQSLFIDNLMVPICGHHINYYFLICFSCWMDRPQNMCINPLILAFHRFWPFLGLSNVDIFKQKSRLTVVHLWTQYVQFVYISWINGYVECMADKLQICTDLLF